MAFKGIDILQTSDRIVFDAYLTDTADAILATGTTNLRLYELQSDGTLKSYDWNSNTFKTTALTTENQAMTHRAGNNGGTNTGLWTYALTTLTGFTVGSIYYAQVTNTGASPPTQSRKFQFGGAEGDLTVTSGNLETLAKVIAAASLTIDGKNLDVALAIIAAAVAGKLSGAGTGTEVFKGLDGSTSRITSSPDASGNRTAVTYP